MENNNTTNVKSEANVSEETKKTAKDSKKSDKKKNAQGWFSQHKSEFKKISWPTREELLKQTVTVIIVSLIVGAFIFGVDTILNLGLNQLITKM